ncbi:hypothetical protein Q8A67_018871 [Cirrhinus molitorella]|uniref:Uncharacterized protein n=1 Tax=Cirrhinus molitorella TaxID=172907 RepID=A0AA88PF99_9TELE|nr:hypothetical protein Q8A67_018871 [Cirrhinus molitorella]
MEVAILLLRASALVPPKFCLFCCCGLLLSHGGLKLHPTLGISGPICSAMVAISSALMASYFASSSLDSSSTLVTSSCGYTQALYSLQTLFHHTAWLSFPPPIHPFFTTLLDLNFCLC